MSASSTSRRTLIADDERQWRNFLRASLEALGCTVDEGSNYCEVRDLLDANRYDLIVSDNRMPLGGESRPDGTCGLQLLAYAKAHGHNTSTPFVLHTSDDDGEVVRTVDWLGGIYRSKDDKSPIGDFLKQQLPS